MHFFSYFVIIAIFLLATYVHTYRILGIFPLAFKSHNIFLQALMKSLARKGHQVDVISYYEAIDPPKNYRDIINLSNLSTSYAASRSKFNSIKEAILHNEDFAFIVKEYYGLPICNLMSHETMQNFIRGLSKNSTYDAVITEGITAPCYYGFGFLLNVPIISALSGFEFSPMARQIGNPLCMSFMPTAILPKFDIKTFWNRLQNTWVSLFGEYKHLSVTEDQSEAMTKYISPNIPPVREVERRLALSILNTHHSMRGVKPVTQAVIEIAGIHVEEDNSVVTAELKQWMDESKHGIVYMSFGTVVPIESLPREKILSIFSSFAKLAPMRVLMKITSGNPLPAGLPDNVLTMEWIPQIPVLKHPNTRLFITHGGIHSLIEALYFGVPVIGIPLFFDQHQNVRMLAPKNVCIELDHDEITEHYLDAAFSKILNDSRFREAAKHHSRIFRDRPMSPSDEAVYWIEHVIRNGAESLRSPAVNMHWWQTELLDIYGFLILCTLLIIYIIKISVQAIFRQCLIRYINFKLNRELLKLGQKFKN